MASREIATVDTQTRDRKDTPMKNAVTLIVAALLLVAAGLAGAEEIAGLPLHVRRLGENAVRIWLGDFVSSTAVVALATTKGIVVVDTVGIPKVDEALRKVIAREFGRDDFVMLINTHEHGDHTGGNSVYADCTIVGHEAIVQAMQAPPRDNREWIEWSTRRIAGQEAELTTLQPGSEEARKVAEQLVMGRLLLANSQSRPAQVAPIRTFSDRLKLDMGDTTFELYWIGGLHSASDTAILIPERGLLLTGDTMADTWLTDTPGCLASFGARPDVPHDFPLMLANWDLILARKDSIKLLLPGHWNGELSMAGARARVEYVRALWDGAGKAVAAGKGLEDLQAEYALATRFPDLVSSPGFSPRFHTSTVTEMWKLAANQQSAADRLYELVDQGAPEAAVREVLAERHRKPGKYYFTESEINAAGYRLLQATRKAEAIRMFKLNVELFPDAWNVYDSLGEALLASGDTAGAAKMYTKSLSLNPESPSGKQALARIEGSDGE